MSTFSRYVLRLFALNFAILLLTFVAVLQLFDILSNGADLLERQGNSLSALLLYALLRLPEIASQMTPFAVLLSALLTLAKLERDREILAFKSAGGAYSAVLLAFLPVVILIGIGHFLLADRLVPIAIQELIARDLTPEKPVDIADIEPLFLQDGDHVVEARFVEASGTHLIGLRLYARDAAGNILGETYAQQAYYDRATGDWRLADVWQADFPDGQPARVTMRTETVWQTALTPAEFSDLIERPQGMALEKLWRFAASDQVGVRPAYFYATWLNKRIALPISSILMILLAAPIASSLQRRDRGLALGMSIGFCLGFLYFIADGLVLALGESGAIAPALAAWLPILLFAGIGGAWLIRLEGY